jgi:TPR repeat protein
VKADPRRALELYRKGKELGSVIALGSLSNAYMIGLGGIPVDDAAARVLAEEGCKQAEGGSCNNLGVLYFSGRGGLAVDKTRALELFVKACTASLDAACRSLGEMYAAGVDVPLDKAAAADYFALACALGDAPSCAKKGP